MFTNVVIDGKKYEVYHKSLNTSGHEYVVYNEKIWKIVARMQFKIKLEREIAKEEIWIDLKNSPDIKYIVSQTGYIPC